MHLTHFYFRIPHKKDLETLMHTFTLYLDFQCPFKNPLSQVIYRFPDCPFQKSTISGNITCQNLFSFFF